jgi:hypothetical protein
VHVELEHRACETNIGTQVEEKNGKGNKANTSITSSISKILKKS